MIESEIPQKLIDEIARFRREKKFGNIQINFVRGRIYNINRVDSVRIEGSEPKKEGDTNGC